MIVVCDGLKGLPEAIGDVWPLAIVQTCVIHLIRASMRYVSYDDRKKLTAALRPVYTAVNEAAAKAALEQLRAGFGKKAPGVIAAWDRAWPQFIPFLEFDVAIRKVIYTTNAIESVNFQLRKIIKNRGHFPDDDAALKLLYLGVRNITGRHKHDGTVTIFAVTSTVSASGDQGADPNLLVKVRDRLDATTLPTGDGNNDSDDRLGQFKTIRAAKYGEVLRGVAFAPRDRDDDDRDDHHDDD